MFSTSSPCATGQHTHMRGRPATIKATHTHTHFRNAMCRQVEIIARILLIDPPSTSRCRGAHHGRRHRPTRSQVLPPLVYEFVPHALRRTSVLRLGNQNHVEVDGETLGAHAMLCIRRKPKTSPEQRNCRVCIFSFESGQDSACSPMKGPTEFSRGMNQNRESRSLGVKADFVYK